MLWVVARVLTRLEASDDLLVHVHSAHVEAGVVEGEGGGQADKIGRAND